ncbi:MAG: DNA replication terminus site-binding protein [Candidatus Berkiella sp.]
MSESRIELLAAFDALTDALSQLCNAILLESHLVAWLHHNPLHCAINPELNIRENICQVLTLLYYRNDQAPREIMVCPGFIGASSSTLKLATQVNECKERFKIAVMALKNEKRITQLPEFTEKINSMMRNVSLSTALSHSGLSRLHLKQCYRKIPILNQAPSKISWTWAHTRSIKKITVEKAQEMLLKKGSDAGIEIQLAKLSALPANEKLAIVQELAPHLRANLVFKQGLDVSRAMIKGPIPIFFLCDEQTPCPQYHPPKERCDKDKSRAKRSDEKLDPVVYLPAIRAHRYDSVS